MNEGQDGGQPEGGRSGPRSDGGQPDPRSDGGRSNGGRSGPGSTDPRSIRRRAAARLADRAALPTALRAVLGYYAESGVIDLGALRLKRRVEAEVDAIVAEAFEAVEAAMERELGAADASFDYGTKLTMPVELTLGYCYRRADDDRTRERAEGVARLVTEALLDGDMRDAINDGEYGDFAYELDGADPGPERVAEIAQSRLRERVEAGFEEYPEDVRAAYEWAVAVSERHQAEDERFRELLSAARAGDPDARERIAAEYRDADFAAVDAGARTDGEGGGGAGTHADGFGGALGERDRELPYCRTQYERVGVIYEGMIEMFRAAGLEVDEAFERSIVLAIVGAQVWLDDVDDFREDMAEGQLTPVTAEYLLVDDDPEAYRSVVELARAYLDAAAAYATESDSPLTGIAAEYVYRSGDPGVLPGSP